MSLAKKLQLKENQRLQVVNAPRGLDVDVPTAAKGAEGVLVFVKDQAELKMKARPALDAARSDRLAWIAYPKGGRLDTDLSRDILWDLLKAERVKPVRQISIDDVWSALRFRPA